MSEENDMGTPTPITGLGIDPTPVEQPVEEPGHGLPAPQNLGWVNDPEAHRLFSTITWLWALIFGVRVAIMFPLYLLGQTAALGSLKILLGYPLFALGIFITFKLLAKSKKASETSND